VAVDPDAKARNIKRLRRSVGREFMRNHLRHCATSAIKSGSENAGVMYDELVDLMYKHSR
jgi:DNA-binding FrmR family transcriptional regulator